MILRENFVVEEVGAHYKVPMYEVKDNEGIVEVEETLDLLFVRGSKLPEENVERRTGTLHEHIISVLISDLQYKNSLVPSRETSLAITKLEEALFWLRARIIRRENGGTLGTYQA